MPIAVPYTIQEPELESLVTLIFNWRGTIETDYILLIESRCKGFFAREGSAGSYCFQKITDALKCVSRGYSFGLAETVRANLLAVCVEAASGGRLLKTALNDSDRHACM